MTQKVFRVITENGQTPRKYEYQPCRNIFLTRDEAELLKVSISVYNYPLELIIEESEVQWKESGS